MNLALARECSALIVLVVVLRPRWGEFAGW